MLPAVAAVVGLVMGLAAHDLAVQSLDERTALRPFRGTCPQCGAKRGWAATRCQECGRQPRREVLIALGAAAGAAAIANGVGWRWALAAYLGFVLLTTALVVTDLRAFRIVDRLNIPGTAVLALLLGLGAVADGDLTSYFRGLLGASAYFAGALVLWLMVRGRGFGAGDVKLAPQLGLFTAYLSWGTLGWAVFITALTGGVVAVVAVLVGSAGMKTELPYGPPMVVGAWAGIALVGVGAL